MWGNFGVRMAVWAVWGAYVSSYAVLFYTLALMYSAPFRNDLFAIWAILVLYVLDSTDSIAAYGRQDSENAWRCLWDIFIAVVYVGMVVIKHTAGSKLKIPIWMLYVTCMARPGLRFAALRMAGKSSWLMHCNKVIADFMSLEEETSRSDGADPEAMNGYNYIVTGEGESVAELYDPYDKCLLYVQDKQVVTVDKVWSCRGKLLRGDRDGLLKDTCLSFALFKLLRRRYAEFPLAEAGHEKARRFVHRLLSRKDFSKAFRVVEMELAFLFDLFYTKYAAMMEGGFPVWKFATEVITALHTMWIAIKLRKHSHGELVDEATSHSTDVDALVTRIVLFGWVLSQIMQFYALLSSNWLKVWLLCKYIKAPSWHENWPLVKLIKIICCLSFVRPWANQIGQHNLFSLPCGWGWKARRHLPWRKSISHVQLPDVVKTKVLRVLKDHDALKEENCRSETLNPNNLKLLVKKYDLETNTQRIVVWHIATSLCEIVTPNRSEEPVNDVPMTVATVLSNYCGYLVACAPNLLPGNAYSTTVVYESVASDIREMKRCGKLGSLWLQRDKVDELGNIVKDMTQDSCLVQKGFDLGMYLIREIQSPEKRWKLLEEFWVEMVLFVAPSENATAHAEMLTGGGEFLTHLWALLTHAGILERSSLQSTSSLF